jgi:hypothetical protein
MQSCIPETTSHNHRGSHQSASEETPQCLKTLGEDFSITWLKHGGDFLLDLAGGEVHHKKEWASIVAVRDGTEIPAKVAEMLIVEI